MSGNSPKEGKQMDKTQRVIKIVEILRKVIPELNPPIHGMFEVQRKNPYRVLVCGILSARSKDEKTVPVCRKLFEKFPTPEDLLKAPLEEIEETLKGIGLHRQKAKYLKESVKLFVEKYNKKLPKDLKELMKFPGVGRKIANIILIHAHGIDTIAVDTHVHRIANLLGLVNTQKPEQTEEELKKIVPKELWKEINYLLVGLGQTVCEPKKPKCDICPIREYCKYGKNLSLNHKNNP
jgi:endonuclease-3